MEFKRNEYINITIDKFLDTWSHLIDSENYVNPKYLKKIDKYIYKNMLKKFREIEVYRLLYMEGQGIKLGLFERFKVWLSGLRPVYNVEQAELVRLEKEKKIILRKKLRKKS